jgi:N-acetylmuramoyl-L-alanine amidase
MLFVSIKRRTIIFVLCGILFFSAFFSLPAILANTREFRYSVVIDAGHGGYDGGMVSPFSGVDENHLNLSYAFCLKDILENVGIKVILTRKNLGGLYSIFAENRKKDDMQKRIKIIENSGANLAVSIHMNSFPLRSSCGAQVFFKQDDPASQKLANNIQNVLYQNLPNARSFSKPGDYYILNQSPIPTVIVECGFLTNQEEEKLLRDENYMKKVCLNIAYGILISL